MKASLRALAALSVALLIAGPVPALSACREAAVATLPMPAWTWLRSWRHEMTAPTRLAADEAGRLWVSDPTGGRLVARQADGAVATLWRLPGRPTAVAAAGLGRMLVGDAAAGRVTMHNADGEAGFALGVGDGEFGRPGAIAVDPARGEIFVSDTARHEVGVYSPAGVRLRTIGSPAPANDLPAADGQLRTPTGLVIAGDELLVADQLNYRVQAFDKATGAFRYCIGTYRASSFFPPNSGPSRTLGMAQGLAVDALGRLYVADAYQGQVRVLDRSNGATIGAIGGFDQGPGALRNPSDLRIDGHGRLFVANTGHGRLEVFGLDAFTDPETVAPATAAVSPARIDRLAPPADVVMSLEVPGYRVIDIDPASLLINGLPASAAPQPQDGDGNGIPELRVRVAGAALLPTLGDGERAPVVVSGRLGTLAFSAGAQVQLFRSTIDEDGDGVPDRFDACPGSASGEPVDASGCSVAQRCPCAGPPAGGGWRDPVDYLRCVRVIAGSLRVAGRISLDQHGAQISRAATSGCGRKP